MDEANRGTLSVVVPNFNHSHYLPHALAGIFAQTRLPDEVIILDDASTDHSWDIIQAWAEKYPKYIKAYQNPENLGMLGNQQKGLSLASGEYVYIHSSDDLITPTCFETYTNLLDEHPQAALAASRVASFRGSADDLRFDSDRWVPAEGYYAPETVAQALRGRAFSSGQAMYRKAVIEAAGFHSNLHGYCDWYWLHSGAFRHGICFSPKVLCLFRLVAGSEGQLSMSDAQKHRRICHDLLELLLAPEQRDILPLFVASGVMAQLGDGFARYLCESPDLWTPEVLALAQGNLHNRVAQIHAQAEALAVPELDVQLTMQVEEAVGLCTAKTWRNPVLVGSEEAQYAATLPHWAKAGIPTPKVLPLTPPKTLPEKADVILVLATAGEKAIAQEWHHTFPSIPLCGVRHAQVYLKGAC